MSADRLLELGNDQLANMYEVVFPVGIPGSDLGEDISLRLDQSFDPPEETLASYDILKHGEKYTKTSTMEETTKEFTIDVRLDSQWAIHDALENWYLNVQRKRNDIDPADLRVPVVIQALNADKEIVKSISYMFSVLRGYKIATLDNNASDPLRVTMNFIYGFKE